MWTTVIGEIRKELRNLWEKDELINMVLETDDGQQFRVHWELAIPFSPFLHRKVLAQPDIFSSSSLYHLKVPNVSSVAMREIIKYIYSGTLNVDSRKVPELINAARVLEMPEIQEFCCRFLKEKINEDTCIDIHNFAKDFKLHNLSQITKSYLLSNFEKIYRTSSFLEKLSFEDLESLIQSDYLNISSEEKVFFAVMRWMEHVPDLRLHHLSSLLGCIRFGFCKLPFFNENVIDNAMISKNSDCQAILIQASMLFAEMNGNEDQVRPIDLRHPLIRPRIPSELIFVIGGWSNGSATNVIETYDIRAGRWFLSSYNDVMPRAYHGLISLDGIIYMIGGFDGNQCFNTVRCFDCQNHRWYEGACMYVARCYISVTDVNGIIYALGGYDGHVRVSSAESYSLSTNQWHMIASMHQVRSDASAATLNGKIFIAGGFNGQQVLNSVEVYDPDTDVWTMIPEMSSPRSGVNLIAYNDTVFVIGGFNGTNRLNTVERYDARLRQWTAVAAMNIPRSNFATATIEGYLFVIGGFNVLAGLTTVSSVECYDALNLAWRPVADMNINRSALSACVIKGLPNSKEYSFLGNSMN